MPPPGDWQEHAPAVLKIGTPLTVPPFKMTLEGANVFVRYVTAPATVNTTGNEAGGVNEIVPVPAPRVMAIVVIDVIVNNVVPEEEDTTKTPPPLPSITPAETVPPAWFNV